MTVMTELPEAVVADDAIKVEALIGAGASVNLADADGVPPLAHAKARGFAGMIHPRQRAGAK